MGYGDSISDSLTLSDSQIFGYGNATVDQLTIIDQSSVGYGDIISDSMANWFDTFVFSTGQPAINLTLSDTLVASDQLGAGYGNGVQDTSALSDATQFVESMLVMIVEASPSWLDALQELLSYGLQLGDLVTFQEQVRLLYGMSEIGETFTFSDQININLINVVALLLSDSEAANWFDGFFEKFVFAPGVIGFDTLSVLNQMVINLRVKPQMQVDDSIEVLE